MSRADDRPTLQSLTVMALDGFEPVQIALKSNVAILSGINSAGKSRLIEAISRFLNDGDESQVRVDLAGQSPSEIVLVDTFLYLRLQRLALRSDMELGDRIEAAGYRPLSEKELALASYVLGREYELLEIAEIETASEQQSLVPEEIAEGTGPNDDIEYMPIFRFRRRGFDYDSRLASLGELAALTVFWAMRRVTSKSIVLMEEPETFLSPAASARLLDAVAFFAAAKKSAVILTSHSYLGLVGAPEDSTVLLQDNGAGETRLENGTKNGLWRALRMKPPTLAVFLVEDEAAEQWTRMLLRLIDFPEIELVEVRNAKGVTRVRGGAALFTAITDSQAYFGFLDGDERNKPEPSGFVFLPGDKDPEATVLSLLAQFPGESTTRPASLVREALAATEGANKHDRIGQIAVKLAFNRHELLAQVLMWWHTQHEDGKAQVTQFKADVGHIDLSAMARGTASGLRIEVE